MYYVCIMNRDSSSLLYVNLNVLEAVLWVVIGVHSVKRELPKSTIHKTKLKLKFLGWLNNCGKLSFINYRINNENSDPASGNDFISLLFSSTKVILKENFSVAPRSHLEASKINAFWCLLSFPLQIYNSLCTNKSLWIRGKGIHLQITLQRLMLSL